MPTEFGPTIIISLFILFTSIFLATGLGMIISGIVIQMRFNIYLGFVGSKYNGVAMILILIGTIIMVAGILGTYGTIHENQLMLSEFICLLMTIVSIEAILFLNLVVNRAKIDEDLREVMMDATVNYNNDGSEGVTFTWDLIHKQFHCCGTNGINDWSTNKFLIRRSIPDSCCKEVKDDCGKGLLSMPSRQNIAHSKGCFDAVKDKIVSETKYLLVGVIVLIALQACLVLFHFKTKIIGSSLFDNK